MNKVIFLLALLVVALIPQEAYAAGSGGMPWETWLTTFVNAATGPIARAVGVLVLLASGIALAMGDMGQGTKNLVKVCFGLSIAFAAASWGLPFLGFAGGATI